MSRRKDIRKLCVSAYASPHHGTQTTPGPINHGPPTQHHLIPRSRGGPTERNNLLDVPRDIHHAFHYLFGNMLPEQIILYIASVWSPPGYFDYVHLGHGREQINCGQKALTRFASQPIDRYNVPAFRDIDRNQLVRTVRRQAERHSRHLRGPRRHH